MRLSNFFYDLPSHRIAQIPMADRSASRLLDAPRKGPIQDRIFSELPRLLRRNDLLIMNDTLVLPARLLGSKMDSGGRVEILVERLIDQRECIVQIRASRTPATGSTLVTDNGTELIVGIWENGFHRLRLMNGNDLYAVLEIEGHVPLPPYIQRTADLTDRDRYQTVYAREPGAVAAPTAGLHFDNELLAELQRSAIEIEYLTLHVGAGTFQPIRERDIRNHLMHREWISVPERVVNAVARTKSRGGRVVAVGTTVVRALESAARSGKLVATKGDTDLFISPGFEFQIVDMLITNFHLPKSTLLVLVSAFAGLDNIQRIYSHAIKSGYRFYSYGDAMRLEGQRVCRGI